MRFLKSLVLILWVLSACNYPQARPSFKPGLETTPSPPVLRPDFTLPARPYSTPPASSSYNTGDTLLYSSQPGDTLLNLAGRFQTTPADILSLNPALQNQPSLSFLQPGTSIQIKLQQEPDWDSTPALFPNDLFVNSPSEAGFDTDALVNQNNGWLKTYADNSSGNHVTGVQIVSDIALHYSISPRLLLALLEYQLHALSDPAFPSSYCLGNNDDARKPFTSQISWMANALNNGFYRWQDGKTATFSAAHIRLNPWQNAATAALGYYFSQVKPCSASQTLNTSPDEFIRVYQASFGPINWNSAQTSNLLPAGLSQPALALPLGAGDKKWLYTGGPHSAWGAGDPLAAIDFAPPAETSGCDASPEWALAVADGVIARVDEGLVMLDLDGDGNSQTGWVIQYLHLLPESVPAPGTHLKQGDSIGHPSCAGGHATGRHVHIARLYNGVWISASATLPFNLNGWVATPGDQEYQGFLTRGDMQIPSSIYGEHESQLPAAP